MRYAGEGNWWAAFAGFGGLLVSACRFSPMTGLSLHHHQTDLTAPTAGRWKCARETKIEVPSLTGCPLLNGLMEMRAVSRRRLSSHVNIFDALMESKTKMVRTLEYLIVLILAANNLSYKESNQNKRNQRWILLKRALDDLFLSPITGGDTRHQSIFPKPQSFTAHTEHNKQQ